MLIINTLLLFVCPRSETVKVASVCFFILCLHCFCVLEADHCKVTVLEIHCKVTVLADSLLSNGASGSKLNSFE